MKRYFLTSCVVFGICNVAYSAQVVIHNPAEMDTVVFSVGDELVINDGGTYSLAKLDTISQGASNVLIDFSIAGGGAHPLVELLVAPGFDGTFNTRLDKVSATKIIFDSDFLTGLPDEADVISFTNISMQGNIVITETGDSGIYSYEFVGDCQNGVGSCVIRRTLSNLSINSAQATAREAKIARIGVTKNPEMLLRPMIIVNYHELYETFDFSNEFFISATPEYYNAKGLQGAGLRLNFGKKVGGRLSLGASAYVSSAEFKNDVSGFESVVYGGNLRFLYDINDTIFLRGIGGVSLSNIDCDDVVKGNKTVNNPSAVGVYGSIDFGAKFNFESGLYLSPFVGYTGDYEKVVDVHTNNSFVRVGGDIGFDYFMDGVKYSYILRTAINTGGYLDASVGIGAWTVSDKIGGNVSVGILDTDFGWSGKVSATVKLNF